VLRLEVVIVEVVTAAIIVVGQGAGGVAVIVMPLVVPISPCRCVDAR